MERNVLRALRQSFIFQNLTDEEIEQAMHGIKYRVLKIDKKVTHMHFGDICQFAEIIITGGMQERMVNSSGKSVLVNRIHAGWLLTPAYIFSKDPLAVSIETTLPTTVLRMLPEDLKTIVDSNFKIRTNFILLLSKIATFVSDKLRNFTLYSARERISTYLLNESKKAGSNIIILTHSRQELANIFGIQKFSVQRCLMELSDDGIIEIAGKKITIINRSRLIEEAAESYTHFNISVIDHSV